MCTVDPSGIAVLADSGKSSQQDQTELLPLLLEASAQVADGLPPLPQKIRARILKGEFVAMHELLPECFAEAGEASKPGARTRAKKRVQEMTAWLQCFATYVGILGPAKPTLIPQLMAYMATIIRASQEFEGSAWAIYDDTYRRQAAASGNWQWARVDPSLYSVCFTGKAKRAGRCERCLSAAHKTEDCILPGDEDPDVPKRLKAIEAAVMALAQHGASGAGGTPSAQRATSAEVCRKYNFSECKFRACKFAHRCATCRGPHPAMQCASKPPTTPTEQGGNANASPLGPIRRGPLRTHPSENPY